MNILKRASLWAVVVSTSFFHSVLSATESKFSGDWEYVEHVAGSSRPYSTFEIKLNEAGDGAVTGSYCFVTQNGNRIDCNTDEAKNISGHISEDGQHAEVNFYSFFGAKGGKADLVSSDDTLTWKVMKNPTGDFFYGPYTVTLDRKQTDGHQGERQVVVDKAYLYPTPSETRTKTYIVKGDYAKLINISNDLKFWKIFYSGKNGTVIERWIDCHAIDSCP